MKNKKLVLFYVLTFFVFFEVFGETNKITIQIREQLEFARNGIPNDFLDYHTLEEILNFEHFGEYSSYKKFSLQVSNDWRSVLGCFDAIATNKVDRLLLLGVGKQFDEDFYIDYISELCVLCTNNIITSGEMDWAITSARYDLQSCFIRRYKESKIIALLNSLKSVFPNRLLWDRILSGERYANYLHEVEAGLWGPNGKKVQ